MTPVDIDKVREEQDRIIALKPDRVDSELAYFSSIVNQHIVVDILAVDGGAG
jgi:hypothetical protein